MSKAFAACRAFYDGSGDCAIYSVLRFGCARGSFEFFIYPFYQSVEYPDLPDLNPGDPCEDNEPGIGEYVWEDETGPYTPIFTTKTPSSVFPYVYFPDVQAAYRAAIPDGATMLQFGDRGASDIILWWTT